MWRLILGVSLCGLSVIGICLAQIVRFDSAEDYEEVIWNDVVIGAMIAGGIGLIGVSVPKWSTRRCLLLLAALTAGMLVSGGLIGCHYRDYHTRSTLPQ